MVVLITGGSGQLGMALQSIAKQYPDLQFHFANSAEADITNKENLQQLFNRLKPDYCINAAAYTAVDKAESEPEKAYAVNVTGVKNLAETCKDFNSKLIHISTDFVFNGNQTTPYKETDTVHPQGVYGQTKQQGEAAVAATFGNYFIIRTSWVYSDFANNFMKTMLRLAQDRDTLNVVADQTGTPTHAVDLAKAILTVIQSRKNAYGIYHYSNEGQATWYEFAAKIFEANGVTIDLKPIPTSSYPTPAERPKYSVLDKTKIKNTFGIGIKNWEDALVQYTKLSSKK